MTMMLAPLAACGGSSDDGDRPAATGQPSEETETETGSTEAAATRPCSEDRHLVVFDFAGMLTVQDELDVVAMWVAGNEPDARPGTAELTTAYRERGYELLYITAAPPELTIDGQTVPEAVEGWLERNGFAVDDGGTDVLGYTGSSDDIETARLSITDELIRLAGEQVHLDAGYTDDADRVYPFASGGIPGERIYTVGPDAGIAGTTAIANDDIQAHLTTVQALPQVCTPG